jgi:hypothetical protein
MVISRLQATEYRERLKQGVEVAAEAIAASGTGNGAQPSGDGAVAGAASENGAGQPAEKQTPSAA